MLRTSGRSAIVLLAALALVVAACGGDGDGDGDGGQAGEDGAVGDETTTEGGGTTSSTSPSTEAEASDAGDGQVDGDADDDTTADAGSGGDAGDAAGSTDDTDRPGDDAEPEPVDWLTFARGLTFVSLTGLQSGSAADALAAVDGDPATYGVTDDESTVEFVYELPAMTTLDRLAVPNILDRPGNDTALRFLTVEGSSEGPDAGWQVLADAELELHDDEGQLTELAVQTVTPIRWLRLTMRGGILVEPGDEGRTIVRFSELIGNGTQEPITEPADFAGRWEFDLTERPDFDGEPLEIGQTGAAITGCWGDVTFTGSVNGAIARATGRDAVRDRPAAFIFVADVDDGSITALVSENGGFFKPYVTTDNAEIGGCLEEAAPTPRVCATSAYVNFDVDSAAIRPESLAVLRDLYQLLVAEGSPSVAIVGHTSTEGDADHNLDLSRRRAEAIVDDLVGRGFDRTAITADGRGETEPLVSPDDTETAREINRRVDIVCV